MKKPYWSFQESRYPVFINETKLKTLAQQSAQGYFILLNSKVQNFNCRLLRKLHKETIFVSKYNFEYARL
jgi:hypothetical protein